MKTYYAYSRSCMEKIDSCQAISRKDAAKKFAAKKQISLKDWLGIYVPYTNPEMDKMYGHNIFFKKDGIVEMHYKVLKFELLVIRRSAIEDTKSFAVKVMTRNKFCNFIQAMKKQNYTVVIGTTSNF